jgi:Mlc titration factor MtfA (ptsG expression regulator)
MVGVFGRWRRARILARATLNAQLWESTIRRFPFAARLNQAERERLRERVILFLAEKSIHGAAGFVVTEEIRVLIAVQACMLILNLDLDYYRGWVEIIVYPDEFTPEIEYTDDAGVVHVSREPMAGESWLGGPVILSAADVDPASMEEGVNVVIHEFAHKLDMLNGEANGFPPLHAGMDRRAWKEAFTTAYANFCERLEGCDDSAIDPYAAEHPAEFFAVLSETFFQTPSAVQSEYPVVYAQLVQFYRQDPAARECASRAE